MDSYRGVVREGRVVLLGREFPWTEGTEVWVTPVIPDAAAPFDAPPEWVEHVARLKAEGKRQSLPPELIELARNELTAEEVRAGVEKLKAEGGRHYEEFIHDLKKAANGHG
jgi:hypothetical protein